MKYPKVIFVDPKKNYIYIKNILDWSKDNQKIQKNFSKLNLAELLEGMSLITQKFSELWTSVESSVMSSLSWYEKIG